MVIDTADEPPCVVRYFDPDAGNAFSTMSMTPVKANPAVFNFSRAFGPEASNPDITSSLLPVLRGMLYGFSIVVMTDGYSGSGKSHTLLKGPAALAPLAIKCALEAMKDNDPGADPKVTVQAVQIYKNKMSDLLSDSPERRRSRSASRPRLGDQMNVSHPNAGRAFSQSPSRARGITIDDAEQQVLTLGDDIHHFCVDIDNVRHTGSTLANSESSRSSLIMKVMDARSKEQGSAGGCLVFIDLCGEEDQVQNDAHRKVEYSGIVGERSAVKCCLKQVGKVKKGGHDENLINEHALTRFMHGLLKANAKFILISHLLIDNYKANENILKLKMELEEVELPGHGSSGS